MTHPVAQSMSRHGVDEDPFEGRTLLEGFLREDPRSATAALGDKRLAAAVDDTVAALKDKLTGSA
jgi:creatinine amidohydrolase/Fe(II)-dependent formamide hydrolase-like protein